MKTAAFLSIVMFGFCVSSMAQMKPDETEIWAPEPKPVAPGNSFADAPSDALILFDGKKLDGWVSAKDTSISAKWIVTNGLLTVDKKFGTIQTRKRFNDYQLHLEWRIPSDITGEGQSRGNSGVFLASAGLGDNGYELQILDSYHNKTYINGQAGSIYKQYIPLVNACRKPGEWQTFDIVWFAPQFNDDGSVKTQGKATVFYNGILVQFNVSILGPTAFYPDPPGYKKHGPSPIKLQAHGDPSEPISFRNIWIREL